MTRLAYCWLLSTLLVSTTAAGEAVAPLERIPLDSDRSSARFSIRVMWLANAEGNFTALSGDVEVDHAHQLARVDAFIDANSVRMRRPSTEAWVKSAEFFDAARHPLIHFLSAPFPLSHLREGGELPGVLTLRGVSAPVMFTILPSTCAQPGRACAVRTSATIQRSLFGMRSRRASLGDKVELGLDIFVHAQPAATSAP